MKLKVLSLTKTEKASKELPLQFSEPIRPDLVKRAVESLQANRRQPYGADPMAGKKCSAELSRRRRKYRGSYGHGISRVPRKIMSRRGSHMNWVGAFAPGTVGGRKAHPAKADKEWFKKINTKERRKAIRSALAATMYKEIVEQRGHRAPSHYPFIIENNFEAMQRTKDVRTALEKLGLTDELSRIDGTTTKGGNARRRGRSSRCPTGPLLVVGKDCNLLKASRNLQGIDVVEVSRLNAETLAPGADVGRLTIFTESAIDAMTEGKLFMSLPKKAKKPKDKPAKKAKKAKPAKKQTPATKTPPATKPAVKPPKPAESPKKKE